MTQPIDRLRRWKEMAGNLMIEMDLGGEQVLADHMESIAVDLDYQIQLHVGLGPLIEKR